MFLRQADKNRTLVLGLLRAPQLIKNDFIWFFCCCCCCGKTTHIHSAPEGCRHVSHPLGLSWVHPCYGAKPGATCWLSFLHQAACCRLAPSMLQPQGGIMLTPHQRQLLTPGGITCFGVSSWPMFYFPHFIPCLSNRQCVSIIWPSRLRVCLVATSKLFWCFACGPNFSLFFWVLRRHCVGFRFLTAP